MELCVQENEVRAEIVRLLEADQTALGDVWRRAQAGQTDHEIRLARRWSSITSAWHYRAIYKALLGELPKAPSVANTAAQTFRRLLKKALLSSAAQTVLEARLAALEELAKDEVDPEQLDVPGVYVYGLADSPYFKAAADENGRMAYKVGHSSVDCKERVRTQGRHLHFHDPVLLRVYETGAAGSFELERTFHRALKAAGHDNIKNDNGGKEWFATSLEFLDELARSQGLSVRVA